MRIISSRVTRHHTTPDRSVTFFSSCLGVWRTAYQIVGPDSIQTCNSYLDQCLKQPRLRYYGADNVFCLSTLTAIVNLACLVFAFSKSDLPVALQPRRKKRAGFPNEKKNFREIECKTTKDKHQPWLSAELTRPSCSYIIAGIHAAVLETNRQETTTKLNSVVSSGYLIHCTNLKFWWTQEQENKADGDSTSVDNLQFKYNNGLGLKSCLLFPSSRSSVTSNTLWRLQHSLFRITYISRCSKLQAKQSHHVIVAEKTTTA